MGIEVHKASPHTIKRSIFVVLRSYMVSFAMAARLALRVNGSGLRIVLRIYDRSAVTLPSG